MLKNGRTEKKMKERKKKERNAKSSEVQKK